MATQKKGVVRYKVKAVKVAGDMTGKKRYQAQVVNSSVMEFDQFVDHMAEHSSPYTRGTISGVLTDMLDCLKEQILDGKQVRLGDLGLISVGIDGKSAETLEAWNVQQNVKTDAIVIMATLPTAINTNVGRISSCSAQRTWTTRMLSWQ